MDKDQVLAKKREQTEALLKEWAGLMNGVQARSAGLEREIASLKARLDDIWLSVAARRGELERDIRILVANHVGEAVIVPGVARATYRSGYTRHIWDNKALEGFAAAHPEILKLRESKAVAPTIRIELS